MLKTADEAGLSNISNESVHFMMRALEVSLNLVVVHSLNLANGQAHQYHLKDVIASSLPCTSSNRLISTSVSEDGDVASQEELLPFTPHLISTRDLLAGIDANPHILGEHLPITQERIMVFQR